MARWGGGECWSWWVITAGSFDISSREEDATGAVGLGLVEDELVGGLVNVGVGVGVPDMQQARVFMRGGVILMWSMRELGVLH